MSEATILFRADRLLEAISGHRAPVSWGLLRQWREAPLCLWEVQGGTQLRPWNNPILKKKVSNQAISLLESLGHIDVNWSDKIVARKPNWYLTSWVPGLTKPEWVLAGSRCEDLIDKIRITPGVLVEEAIVPTEYDKELAIFEKEKNIKIVIHLPHRVSLSRNGRGTSTPPLIEGTEIVILPPNQPYSWSLLKSTSSSNALYEILKAEMKLVNRSEEILKSYEWLDPQNGWFSRKSRLPDRYQNHRLSLIRWYRPGRGYVYQLLKKNGNSLNMHELEMCELGREQFAWMSFRISSLSGGRSIVHSENGDFRSLKTLKLPRLIKRALVQCSGRPPQIGKIGGRRYELYQNVSSLIACRIAEKLNFDIWDVQEVTARD